MSSLLPYGTKSNFTDHLSLKAIQNKDFDKVTCARELCMLEKLLPYDYEVHHITASKNNAADALSQNPIETYNFSKY